MKTIEAGERLARASEDHVTSELLKQQERGLARALCDRDLGTIERMWSDDFTFTAPSGLLLPKADFLMALETRALRYELLEVGGLSVCVYDETAIINGRSHVKARFGRHETHGIDRYQTVYLWQDARWQAVSTLATRVHTFRAGRVRWPFRRRSLAH